MAVHDSVLAYCANPECCEPLTVMNWPNGGTVDGSPHCPDCFRAEEAREAGRKELAEERYPDDTLDIEPGYCQCGCGEKTSIAKKTRPQLGHVEGRPVRYRSGHGTRGRVHRAVDYIEQDTGHETPCWIWQGPVKRGYGVVAKNDRPNVFAHRAYFERAHGPIPSGKVLHHICETKLCVNPAHLSALTRDQHLRLHNPKAKSAHEDEVRSDDGDDFLQSHWSCLERMGS